MSGSVVERLAERGIDIAQLNDLESGDPEPRGYALDGPRLICGMSGINPDVDFSFLRAQDSLTEDDTIPLPPEHPVAQTSRAALLAVFATLIKAHRVLEHGVDGIERCVRLDLAVVCTPGFRSLGHIERVVAANFREVLGQAVPMALSTIGVAALPNGALVAAGAEYRLHVP